MILAEPSFVLRTELTKAARDNGFRLELDAQAGWLHFRSTTLPGDLWLASSSPTGPWVLALSLPAMAETLGPSLPIPEPLPIPAPWLQSFPTLSELHTALNQLYQFAVNLPDLPLREFLDRTASLPRTTEAERLVVQRIGQDLFRERLMKYWNGRCPLTGITDPALLRASHIVPWSECESDFQRLDPHNGLLLSALWDAAFDAGLISFDDNGHVLYSGELSAAARTELRSDPLARVSLTDAHRANLLRHRRMHKLEITI